MKICLGLCLTSSVLRGYSPIQQTMRAVIALIAGLLTAALGFARDAVYVEIIAVKAGLHDLAVFLPPQDLNIHPRRPPARQLARVAPQQMVEGISELPTVLTSFDTVHKSNCRGASPPLLNHGLHAIDAG